MALDAIVDSLDNVNEALHSEYVEVDGKFVLDVTEVGGMALENVQGLKSALQKERTSVKGLNSQISKYKTDFEGVDLDELNGFKGQLEEMTTKYDALAAIDPEGEADKLAKGKADARVKKLQKEWQTLHDAEISKHGETVTGLTDKTTVLEKQLHNVLVRTDAIEQLTKANVDHLDLMLPQVLDRMNYEVTESGFNTFVADGDGNARVKSDGTDMKASDLVEELKQKYPDQFKINLKSGGGKPPGGGGGQPPKENMTASEKIAAGLANR